jgi:hypothetical protein
MCTGITDNPTGRIVTFQLVCEMHVPSIYFDGSKSNLPVVFLPSKS